MRKIYSCVAVIVVFLFVFGSIAFADPTVTPRGTVTCVSNMPSSGSWDYGKMMRISKVNFHPGAVDDYITICNISTDCKLVTIKSGDGEDRSYLANGDKLRIVIDFDNSSLSSGAYVSITEKR